LVGYCRENEPCSFLSQGPWLWLAPITRWEEHFYFKQQKKSPLLLYNEEKVLHTVKQTLSKSFSCVILSSSFIFANTGVWTQGFTLMRQVLYDLNYTFSLFCSVGVFFPFGNWLSIFVQAKLNHNPHILSFALCLGWQVYTTMPSLFSV
jgi:hypothetical protein